MTAKQKRIFVGFLCGIGLFVIADFLAGSVSVGHSRDWEKSYQEAGVALSRESTPYGTFSIMVDAEIPAFECGQPKIAKAYALATLQLAPAFKRCWNYGNAIHNGHVVLGRCLLAQGDVNSACLELLLAGRTPGSPQLDSFGPNMSLARDLLKAGRRATVLQYLNECRVFWRSDCGALTKWRMMIRLHVMPDFGTHLLF